MSTVSSLSLTVLLNDNQSASSELLRKTIDWLLASLSGGQTPDKLLTDLSQLCSQHPSMALLQNLLRFFQKIPLNANRLKAWLDMYKKHETAACRHFAAHLALFKNILVYSNSGLLLNSLKIAADPMNVFCAEGRPAFEGRILAERLAKTHHRIYLVSDIASFSVLQRVEILAFGCDTITPRGILNKIGTSALAAAARSAGKKSYVVATSEKVTDKWSEESLLRQGPRNEIYAGTEPIQVENYYFDLTQHSLLDGIFLETGLTKEVAA